MIEAHMVISCDAEVREVRLGRRGNDSMYTKNTNVHMFVEPPDWLYGGIHTPVWMLPAAAGGSPVRAASITGTLLSSQPAELQHPSFFSFPEWRDKLIIICQLSLALVNIW